MREERGDRRGDWRIIYTKELYIENIIYYMFSIYSYMTWQEYKLLVRFWVGISLITTVEFFYLFAMSALSNKGVKAAVVYSGKNKHGVACGWLLAFADTKDTGRRVSTNHTEPSVPQIIGATYFQKTLLLRKEMCYEVKEKL